MLLHPRPDAHLSGLGSRSVGVRSVHPVGAFVPLFVGPLASNREIAEDLVQRVFRELVLPALSAPTWEAFCKRFELCAADFGLKLQAVAALAPRSMGEAQPAVEDFAEKAQTYGGEVWGDAVRDSWASVRRATKVHARLVAARPVLDDREVAAVVDQAGELECWAWCWACIAAVVSIDEVEVAAEVREALPVVLVCCAESAYTVLRAVEIERERAAETPAQVELPLPRLSGEERELEAAAHQESLAFLSRAESA